MRAVFVHENCFYRTADGAVYSETGFSYRVWERYLEVFDELVVIGRAGPAPEGLAAQESGYLSSGPGVTFRFVPNIKTPKGFVAKRAEARGQICECLERADALIARSSTTGLLGVKIARELAKPYLIEMVGCPLRAYWHHGSALGKLLAPVEALQTRLAVRDAPFVLYVTERFLQKNYPTRGRSIACSDVELPPQTAGVLTRRLQKIHRGSRPFTLGLMGALDLRYKGVRVALEALSEVLEAEDAPAVQLRLAGQGDIEHWRGVARDLGVDGHVAFDGVLRGREAVFEWFDELDLYVQPSLTEGLPRAVIEAMGRGCPVLASQVGGIPELLEPKCLHRAGDIGELAGDIREAVESVVWREAQAQRNFDAARRYYSTRLDARRRAFLGEFAGSIEVS
ncbi:MAG: glycosyltransferase [Persicimonas sp.]